MTDDLFKNNANTTMRDAVDRATSKGTWVSKVFKRYLSYQMGSELTTAQVYNQPTEQQVDMAILKHYACGKFLSAEFQKLSDEQLAGSMLKFLKPLTGDKKIPMPIWFLVEDVQKKGLNAKKNQTEFPEISFFEPKPEPTKNFFLEPELKPEPVLNQNLNRLKTAKKVFKMFSAQVRIFFSFYSIFSCTMSSKSVVWKFVKDGKCQVKENEKICDESVNKEHLGSVWRHFERFHKKFYNQLKIEEKIEQPTQPKLDAFVNLKSGPLKDLALLFAQERTF